MIYLILVLCMSIPLLMPIDLPISIGKPVVDAYNTVESTPDGSIAFINFDYSSASATEMYPISLAFMRHAVRKNFKFVTATFASPDSILFEKQALELLDLSRYKYGVDYVLLGYFPGGDTSLAAFARDTQGLVKSDLEGRPTADMPLMQKIRSAKDFDIWLVGHYDPLIFIRQICAPYGAKVVAGVTSVVYPSHFQYYQSGQYKGVLNGVRGGAEYERLMRYYGPGSILLNILSIYHVVLVGMIVVGNVVYLSRRLTKK